MSKSKISALITIILITLSLGMYYLYQDKGVTVSVLPTVTYRNTDYGFTLTLPNSWQGHTVVERRWEGVPLLGTAIPKGPKLLIRNPNWTESEPYEDIPILVFTISDWNAYFKEDFSISAAPIKATELARNNTYVFALPPRWDFDYRLGYKEAQDIVSSNPLKTFDL